jgi:hypothetical protein
MTEKVRLYRTTTSELMTGINRILKYVTVAVIVVGPVLFLSQRRSTDTWQEAVQGAVAGMVGIVPEGLVLLTSVAFFAAAVSLGRRRVLVQELAAVEGLARIDVIGLDKTGALTEGDIALDHVEQLNPVASGVGAALGALAAAATPTPPSSPSAAPIPTPATGRPPPLSPSPRRGSGAPRPSPATAHGCSALRTSSGPAGAPTTWCWPGPPPSPATATAHCCSRTPARRPPAPRCPETADGPGVALSHLCGGGLFCLDVAGERPSGGLGHQSP